MTGARRNRSLLFATALMASSAACDGPAHDGRRLADDSVAVALAKREPALTWFFARVDSMAEALRRDSATVRADTAYWQWHDRLNATLAQASTVLMRNPGAESDSIARLLPSRGIWTYEAEGNVYFEASHSYLLERTGRWLTPPMREFVTFAALDQEQRPAADGGIAITWDDFFDRLATTEDLLQRHPNVAGADLLRERSHWYLQFALHGGPNSPVFDRRTRALKPELRSLYQRYAAAHRDTPAGKVLADYLRLLAASGYRLTPKVVAFQRDVTAQGS